MAQSSSESKASHLSDVTEVEKVHGLHSSQDTLSDSDGDAEYAELIRRSVPCYKSRARIALYAKLVPAVLLVSASLGYESSLLNALQAVETWEIYFHYPTGALLGITAATFSLTAALVAPLVPLISDPYGRKAGMYVGVSAMFLGSAIQGGSQALWMFILCRIIQGVGYVFVNSCAPILLSELAHPKDRIVLTSLYQTNLYLGAVISASVVIATYAIKSDWAWRIPAIVQCTLPLLQLSFLPFVPESPRWLFSEGRRAEAKAILVKHHGEGDPKDALANHEYRQIKEVFEATPITTPWSALWATPGNRRRCLILICLGLFSQWSGTGLIQNYLAKVLKTIGITSRRDQNIINVCLQIWNWSTALVSAFLTGKFRRRTQFLCSTIGMFLIFSAQSASTAVFNTTKNGNAAHASIALIFLFYPCFNFAFNALVYSYPTEILPFSLRAKGMSLLMCVGKSAIALNTFVNPIGLAAVGWKYYFVYVGWLFIEVMAVYFFFVETKGISLELIAAVFDRPASSSAHRVDDQLLSTTRVVERVESEVVLNTSSVYPVKNGL